MAPARTDARKGYFGAGRLRAKDALEQRPPAAARLRRQAADDTGFAAFKLLVGVGLGSRAGEVGHA